MLAGVVKMANLRNLSRTVDKNANKRILPGSEIQGRRYKKSKTWSHKSPRIKATSESFQLNLERHMPRPATGVLPHGGAKSETRK